MDGKCLPMQTDRPAAPAELLDIICCSCKKLCNTKRCTCRQHGLQCSDVCTECRGTSCSNSELPDVSDDCSHSNRLSRSTYIYAADVHTWRPSWKYAN